MISMLPYLTVLFGLLALALLFWGFKLKAQADLARQRVLDRQRELDQAQAGLGQLKAQEEDTREQNVELLTQRTQLSEQLKAAQEKLLLLGEQEEATLKRQEERFENLANRILEEKGKKLSASHSEELKGMITPLKDQLNQFKSKVEEVYVVEGKERRSLLEQVLNLKDLNQQLSQDTHNLTKALKGDSKTQGTFGEVILERVLEESGLRLGREYELQKSLADQEGGRSRPDAVIHLPENRDLVIDAKCSLTAYEAYYNAEDDAEKAVHLKEHAASVKRHIKQLSEKAYQDLKGIKTLDFVLLFIPNEPALFAAQEADGGLFKLAFDAKVLLVSPSTLLITLKTVNYLWRQEDQSQNAQEIAKEAAGMLDKFVGFSETLEKVGTHLNRAQDSYTDAFKQLKTGKGNLTTRAHKLVDLGATPKKTLPPAEGSLPESTED